MSTISTHIQSVRHLMNNTALDCERNVDDIKLVAVSKQQPCEQIQAAFSAGIYDFAENYLQEALPKIQTLAQLPLTWHFIGAIQSNKTKEIAQHFSWVHSVSRPKIALMLNEYRKDLPPLNVCIQMNLELEDSKSGLVLQELIPLVRLIQDLPQLRLRGLMCIPKPHTLEEQQFNVYSQLHHLLAVVNHELSLNLDTLSMGMTHDFPAAIRAGSTLIRIGQGIFGER